MQDRREQRRASSDEVAAFYETASPDYPEELYDAVVQTVALSAGDRLLELGCATGKATLPLARRGLRITCVEIGGDLVQAARRNLDGVGDVEVIHSAFEAWDPPGVEPFDVVLAATAWHLIDPSVRYRRAWRLLRPGGHLAFWRAAQVFPPGGDPFFAQIQSVYAQTGKGAARGAHGPAPGELPDDRREIEGSGLFEDVVIRHFDWEVVYEAEGYVRQLEAFSRLIAMPDRQRERLHSEIRRRLAQRPDGKLRRHWGAVLHVARRSDTAGFP
jgi:SAM-dependent methyltransferase